MLEVVKHIHDWEEFVWRMETDVWYEMEFNAPFHQVGIFHDFNDSGELVYCWKTIVFDYLRMEYTCNDSGVDFKTKKKCRQSLIDKYAKDF